MADPKHARLRGLFDRALDLPRAQRSSFLESQCGGDAELKARVEALLVAAEDERFLASPTGSKPPAAADASAESAAPLREGPGTHIGPYKLLQLIGEGGFGAVFMAEQEKPVARRVALKIIKLGMDTRQVVARFEQERQALALMDHPNIARVIDAGATETGRPYFVMDLVKGEPIVEYCDKHELTIDERLDLFAQVCAAVQHAHSKGIIHRDLKPSNILVATQDGRPQAKVIDFGIAKATSAKLTDKTLFTEHQQIIGTLQYMSPEQAEGSLDIDTRTDVYALGVLLYELLTGSTPFDKKTLGDAVFGEIRRMIREVDPPKPSTRLSDSHDSLASIAAHRRVEPRRLGTILRGELDWIVMKALEKDRARRYETANGLALDIRRYLSGEVVVAAPPGRAYRFSKFVRRNRVVVSAGGAVAAALLIGVIAFAWQAEVARDQRDRAVNAEKETQARADELKVVSQFQADMLRQIDPSKAGQELTEDVTAKFAAALAGANVAEGEREGLVKAFKSQWSRVNAADTARDLIDRTILKPAIETIAKQFENQPVVDGQLRQTLADLYQDLGMYDAALPLQEQALVTRRRTLGENHPQTVDSIIQMGWLLKSAGKPAEAEPYFREALDKARRVYGEEHPKSLDALSNLGEVLKAQGKLAEAEPYFREALEKAHHMASLPSSGRTAAWLSNLAAGLYESGRTEEAIPIFRKALDMKLEVYGAVHKEIALSMNNLAYALHDAGDLDGAEKLFRSAVEQQRALFGNAHRDLAQTLNNLGFLLNDRGDDEGALECFVEALAVSRRALGDEHPATLTSVSNLAGMLQKLGKFAEAETYSREAMETSRRVLGEEHPRTLDSINTLGFLLESQGRFAEAEPYFRESLETRLRVLGEEHPDTLRSIMNLGGLRVAQGNNVEAVSLLAPIEEKVRNAFKGPDAYRVAYLLMNLGQARAGLSKDPTDLAAAEPVLLEAYVIYVKTLGEKNKDTRDCAQILADFYGAWDKAEPDEGHDAKQAEWKATLEAMPQSAPRPGAGGKQ